MCFSQDCPTGQLVLHSSAEASTSAFASREGDDVEIIGTKSVKKKRRSPVWHFFKPTDHVAKSGIVFKKCNLCVPPKVVTLIGVNNITNMIQHLLRKHKEEYIVDDRTRQKVLALPRPLFF